MKHKHPIDAFVQAMEDGIGCSLGHLVIWKQQMLGKNMVDCIEVEHMAYDNQPGTWGIFLHYGTGSNRTGRELVDSTDELGYAKDFAKFLAGVFSCRLEVL